MGPIGGRERLVFIVITAVCGLWMTSGWHHVDVTVVAMAGVGLLLVADVLSWEVVVGERGAWDVFVWYGGLVTMGELLAQTGSTTAFANWVGSGFAGVPWLPVLFVTLLVYFFSHYAFASITAHVLAMFPPFVLMLVAVGTPPALAVYSLACLANLTAGLTHYGTTSAPIVFGEGYVGFGPWWRIGFLAALANLAIWLTVGFGWWKLLGFW